MSDTMMPTSADRYALAPEPVSRNTIAEERHLIASVLVYPESARGTVLDLPADHFTGERHRVLWRIVADRAARGLESDIPGVCELVYDQPGMVQYVQSLATQGLSPSTPATLGSLAEIVSAGHRGRVTEQVLTAAWQRLASGDVDACLRVMSDVDADVGRVDRGVSFAEAWNEAVEQARSGDVAIVPTPWPSLNDDYLHGGWRGGEVYFIAGAPGVGKTAMGQEIAVHAAMQDHRVGVFSLEMSRTDLARRMVSTASGVDMSEVMRHDLALTAESWNKVSDTLAAVGESIRIRDEMDLTISQVRDEARMYVRRHGAGLIVLDYAQLVEADDPRLTERERIDVVTRGLKAMAKELRIPVVALAQPNRNAVLQGRKLQMQDLHGSSSLEKYGAAVALLNRVMETDGQGVEIETPFVDVDIAKNRYGKRGVIRMIADLGRQRFEEL